MSVHSTLSGADLHPPGAHKTQHENGGSDEMSVAGLSGLLADAQTPTSHATSHENGGGDEMSVAGLSGLLADAQTPLAHKTSHQSGGGDAIKLDDLATPDDNTDLDATSGHHGLLPKLSGSATDVLLGDGSFGAVPSGGYTDEQAQDAVGAMAADTATVNVTYTDATPELKWDVIPSGIKLDDLGAPDDNTDLNASTSAHGLLKKLDNNSAHFLDGQGNWSTPSGTTAPVLADRDAAWAVPGSPNAQDDEFDGSSSATWSDINSPTYSTVSNSLLMSATATDAKKLRVQTAPSTPWVAKCAMTTYQPGGACTPGMWLRKSSDGKLYVFTHQGDMTMAVYHYSGPGSGTFVGTDLSAVSSRYARVCHMAIVDDGTNLKFYDSPDGVKWILRLTLGRTAYMTGGPDQVGIGLNGVDTALDVRFHHFRIESGSAP